MSHRFLRIAAAALVLAGLVTGGGYLYLTTFSPDRDKYPVRGIDVSHHQGRIDWQRVAADDVSFAIIKATEGGDYVDDAFAVNLREARAAGLAVGAYHFFTFCRPGADQAQNFIAAVPRNQPLLPPVVDIEFVGNCEQRPSAEQLAAEVAAFLGPVEAAFGKTAVIYLIGEAADAYAHQITGRLRWIRSLALQPSHDDWVYWQYHNMGRVDGIEGDVDLNVLQDGPSQLAQLFGTTP